MKFYCKPKHLCKVVLYLIFCLCASFSELSGQNLVPYTIVEAQPFMNSLAVLFRARPPWPTSFPPSGAGNTGMFQVFQNSIPQNPSGQVPGPLLASAASQQGILVAHPLPRNPHPNNFQKPPPKRSSFGSQSNTRGSVFFPNQNQNQNQLQMNQNQTPLLSSSSTMTGSFRFPDVPSPPVFQSMIGGDLPSRFKNWQSTSKESFQSSPGQKMSDFRPSPQLLDPYSGYGFTKSQEIDSGGKLYSFHADEAKKLPRYESGFQPITFDQFGFNPVTTTVSSLPFQFQQNFNQQNQYNPWSVPLAPSFSPFHEQSTLSPTNLETHEKIEVSKSVVTTDFSIEEAKSSERPEEYGAKIASSSERVEDWVSSHGKTSKSVNSAEKFKFPVYKKKMRPIKCEKYHRYGFCPVTSNYPLSQVEKIASRCSALLSHLIAPLSKTDVHYDIVVTRNGSLRGRTPSSGGRPGGRGWNWRSYRGKPICDTEEMKIIPGWAKNGEGDWLVILQTQLWTQEAQVSICSPPGPSSKCYGESCEKGLSGNFKNTKCVQRFTAQRLAVLDPESHDRCPVVRSVFLPSACICLSDESEDGLNFGSAESLEHQDTYRGSSSEQVPVILPSAQTVNNGTYMIVSEKFSTKESTAESHEVF